MKIRNQDAIRLGRAGARAPSSSDTPQTEVEQGYSRHFHGVDELQAFLAACWIVPQILPALAPAGAKLRWLGDDDLGFGASSKAR